jgi:hypothetical protein
MSTNHRLPGQIIGQKIGRNIGWRSLFPPEEKDISADGCLIFVALERESTV